MTHIKIKMQSNASPQ